MLKQNELIAVIAVYRQEVRPFTDKQIVLLQNYRMSPAHGGPIMGSRSGGACPWALRPPAQA